MIFLGQASNYSGRQVLRHLFAHGRQQDLVRLKQALAEKYGSQPDKIELYHTGRSALAAVLKAVLPEGGPVFIPGLTCIAVVRAVRAAGCEPVYVDIDRETLQYDFAKLEQRIAKNLPKSQKTIDKNKHVCYNGIIIAQNTLGLSLEMTKLEEIAGKYQLAIVEDLAHSAGRFYPDGREIGTVGQAIALSFGKGKAIDTIEGGAAVLRTESLEISERPNHLPRRGDRWRDRWYPVFGALMRGGCHLGLGKVITGAFLKLKWIARSADAELNLAVGLPAWQAKLARQQLENLPTTPLRGHQFVHDREELLAQLSKHGYHLDEIWYDTPVSPVRCWKEADFPTGDCPETVKIAEEIINLPTWYRPEKLQPVRSIIKEWRCTTDSEMKSAWQEISTRFSEANFLQSPAWGRMNQLVGHQVLIETFGGAAWCLMIIKEAKRGRYLEVPGGPLLDWQDQAMVKQVFAKIRQVARAYHCVFVRLRPQLRNTPENLELLAQLGTKKASFHLHAEHTVMLDLTKTEDGLLAAMRRQTRYEVRRADKLGITVDWSDDEELYHEFHKVQAETAARQHFVPPNLKTLLAERTAFGNQARIYVARTESGEPIAYGLILMDGAEAEYFEAASTDLNRKLPGSYALLWRAMRDLKELGVQRFNLWGIAPPGQKHHRYAGVTTFKTGFGGELVEFMPAEDIVIKKCRYLFNLVIEKLRKKVRHL